MVVCTDPFSQVTTETAPGLVCECLHPDCAQLSPSLSHIGVDGMCWALGPARLLRGTSRERGGLSWAVGSEGMEFECLVSHFLKV